MMNQRRKKTVWLCWLLAAALACGLWASVRAVTTTVFPAAAEFIVIGDMPYHLPKDAERFRRVIDAVNREKPSFTVHVGDIMNGALPCTDENYGRIYDFFKTFQQPLVYTPGDNEWTDCGRFIRGPKDPVAQLEKIRRLFFNGEARFERDLPVTRQSADAAYADYVENVRWEQNNVVFATLHVVGSNNRAPGKNGEEEFMRREAANLAWLRGVFALAGQHQAQGVVLFMQANPNFGSAKPTGFSTLLETLRQEVPAFGKPVLLVHGDSHRFWLDTPLTEEKSGYPVRNFTRVCVFGDREMHGVRVFINPADPDLFIVRPFWVAGN